ncbi:MAG: hypothetical protein RL336_1270, partial [Pseudomonadota bacterium]
GFISKWLLVTAALEQGALGVFIIAVVMFSSLLAVIYVWKVVELFYFTSRPDNGSANPVQIRPVEMGLYGAVLATVAAANIWFGLLPGEPLALAQSAAEILTKGAL